MEPMKDKETDTCNEAMKNTFKRFGGPDSIYCDEEADFTDEKILQPWETKNIK